MKKILFSLLLLSGAAMAQKIPGFHPYLGYAYENFGLPFEYPRIKWVDQGPKILVTDSMVYSPSSGAFCVHKLDVFKYSVKRDVNNKKGKVTISQPYGEYERFKINFGKDLHGRQNVLDLSNGNADLSFKVKNTSAYELRIFAGLVDSSNKVVNAIGPHKDAGGWQDMTVFNIQPGEEQTIHFDFNIDAFDIQYGPDANSPCGDVYFSKIDETFNNKAVSGAFFGIVNGLLIGDMDSYKSLKLKDATFELSELIIGAPFLTLPSFGEALTTDLADETIGESISVYPNPAKEVLHFSKPLENVVLTDIIGNVVFEASEATKVDVQQLPQGVYLLRSTSLQHSMKVRVD